MGIASLNTNNIQDSKFPVINIVKERLKTQFVFEPGTKQTEEILIRLSRSLDGKEFHYCAELLVKADSHVEFTDKHDINAPLTYKVEVLNHNGDSVFETNQ